MEAENMVHSDSMSPTSLGICEKLFRRWELKTSLTEGSARRSQQTLTIRLGLPGHKQQQETYPQPEGAGKRPLCFTGVNSNTWQLSWGAISKPTPARRPLTLGNSRVVEGPAPLKELGSRAQAMRGGPLPRLLPKPHCTGPSWTFLRVVSLLEGGPTPPFRAEPGRVPWAKTCHQAPSPAAPTPPRPGSRVGPRQKLKKRDGPVTRDHSAVVRPIRLGSAKPWVNGEVRAKLKARTDAYNSGDLEEYRKSRYALRRAISSTKRQYRDKVESHYKGSNTRSMWAGLKTLTDYKKKISSAEVMSASLPDEAEHFLCAALRAPLQLWRCKRLRRTTAHL
ncbi:hypothetical protein L3Q82_007779 [Scortum barcoo]|uniref:Uncharacterized protein n=1 Tax=Scortum barcoo TaxID=214431 RepID=A0ACB8WRB9_9TELE|nr:hypothetical protein L3Q82_007779 [Scortum barcoo]